MQRRMPKYSKHKASGQARVRIDGRTIYLGKYDSPDSHRKYDALIARWLSGEKPASPDAMTVSRLCVRYIEEHARLYYRKNGRETSELSTIQAALKPLIKQYGRSKVVDFGPSRLKRIRQTLSGELVDHRQHSNGATIMSAAEHEVAVPYVISILRPKTYARPIVEPQPTTLRLLHGNFQPFKTPQPLNSFVIHMPAFVAKHHRNTTITVPDIRSRQISHSFYQASFTSSGTCKVRRCVDRGWPRTRHDRRSETQSRPRRITYMLDRPTTLRRTQKFPEAASRRIALSRSASASNFFLSCPLNATTC